MIFDSALDIIGNTPLVRLDKIVKKYNLEGEIYAKVEYYSPGLSKKDRIAKYIIEKAIRDGKLKNGQTVIEQTSGNTGIGVALVCAILGYPFVGVMSKGNSIERVKMIEAFGGKEEKFKTRKPINGVLFANTRRLPPKAPFSSLGMKKT